MPTCEPKRGHECGNGSLGPAQGEEDRDTEARLCGEQPRASGHLAGLGFLISQMGYHIPCTQTPDRRRTPLESTFSLSGISFPICKMGSAAWGPGASNRGPGLTAFTCFSQRCVFYLSNRVRLYWKKGS